MIAPCYAAHEFGDILDYVDLTILSKLIGVS